MICIWAINKLPLTESDQNVEKVVDCKSNSNIVCKTQKLELKFLRFFVSHLAIFSKFSELKMKVILPFIFKI